MIIKFLTDYLPHGETKPERDLLVLSKRYLNGPFIWDFIPLMPLTLIFRSNNHKNKLLYLLKVIRLIIGLKVLRISRFMKVIKETIKNKIKQKVKDNPLLGEDIENDHSMIRT